MRVKLLKPHTHAGRDYPAGAELDLADADAQWLAGIKVAEPVTTKPAKPGKTEEVNN
jgi:hypothetical protein